MAALLQTQPPAGGPLQRPPSTGSQCAASDDRARESMGGGAEAPPEMMEEAATPLNGCLLGRKKLLAIFCARSREASGHACRGARIGQKHKKASRRRRFFFAHIDHFFARRYQIDSLHIFCRIQEGRESELRLK